ncbi:MAG: sugar ABC transporter ATP-binding protein [Planctomycetia bacterium]|nr:sugar ABC transporter ATP-binding protein [Planctomycetia bacterium]
MIRSPAEHAVVMRGITRRYPGVIALDGVSLAIRRGEVHAICGENGAGKSTLMKILSGVERPDEGTLEIDGVAVRFSGTRDAERSGIAIIHQELAIVDDLTVADNVFLGRELRRPVGLAGLALVDQRAMVEECRRLLASLECRVSPLAHAGSLRIGDQQLVEIAKALSLDASILVMDEPTSALTEAESARLERTIATLRRRGTTILYISHKMDEVFRLADRITVLRDGRHVRTAHARETSPAEVTGWMVGRDIVDRDFQRGRTPGPSLLSIRNLTLPWPGHSRGHRLSNVSLELRAGEILGVAGLMGAGRTELLETIFGAGPGNWTGEILLHGKPVRFSHPRDACRAGIAMVTEDRKRLGLFPNLDVAGNVSLCRLGEAVRGGLLGRAREETLVAGPIRDAGVKTPGSRAPITGLSGGNQQKCIIARWLLTRPEILLLDDPTRGIDVGAKAELYSLIDGLCRGGMGVILTSSELPELLTLADRIVVLAEGRMTAEFARGAATEQAILEAATGG